MAFCRIRGFACKFLIAQARSFDLNLDAIERRTGDFRAVALNLQWSTNPFLPSADRLGIRRRIPALPFCHVVLNAQKPKSPKYPKNLKTLGDHIRKKRLDLGLFQKGVAKRIGVDETAIYNWEGNRTSPQIHHLPRIIRFLGYNPLPVSESLPDKLLTTRRSLGVTQKTFAEQLGVDPGTLRSWENGKRLPSKKLSRIIAGFLRSPEPELD